jgi:hypothetical protein
VIISVYEPAGDLKTGSFALENETEEELARRRKMAAEINSKRKIKKPVKNKAIK